MKDLHFINGTVNHLPADADVEGYCNFTYASFVDETNTRRIQPVACSEELRVVYINSKKK